MAYLLSTCGCCGDEFCSRCSAGGVCKECGDVICRDCWVPFDRMCTECKRESEREAEAELSDGTEDEHRHDWLRVDKNALVEFCKCGAERRTQERPRKYER